MNSSGLSIRWGVERINKEYERLDGEFGFKRERIYVMAKEGQGYESWVYISNRKGAAIWSVAGTHGEEPAGPMAIAQEVESLGKLGKTIPLVVWPLLNPWGYANDWRYFDEYRDWRKGNSVGDLSHVMMNPETGKMYGETPSSIYAEKLAKKMLEVAKTHPPRWVFDHHEDEMSDGVYVYPLQGKNIDIAKHILMYISEVLPITKKGTTRFGEDIKKGIVIAEPSTAFTDFVMENLGAEGAFTIETPTRFGLESRVGAHTDVIKLYKYLKRFS